jgi:hypothetical protein
MSYRRQVSRRKKASLLDVEEDLRINAHRHRFDPGRPAGSLGFDDVAFLQQRAGNRAVAGLLASAGAGAKTKEKGTEEHKPPVEDDEEEMEEESAEKAKAKEKAGSGVLQVQRFKPTKIPEGKMFEYKAGKTVTPKFPLWKPPSKRSNSDASTTLPKTPKMSGTVKWDKANSKWRYQVDSITSPGTIQIVYYSLGHYPAPIPNDDSGLLINVKKRNWKAIAQDLKDHRTGIAARWSAYRAEDLHEDYHWFREWLPTITPKFTQAQTDIAALGVDDKDSAGNDVSYWDARSQLRSQAKQAFKNRVAEGRTAFNALGDSPGDPPYIAQAPAVDALVKRVEDLGAAKKWP